MFGTIRWTFEDDNGRAHTFEMPNSLYVPEGHCRLLSPQHWARALRKKDPMPRGTRCITYDDVVVLQWEQRKYQRTIPLDAIGSNVATMNSTPGFSKFAAFEAQLPEEHIYCMPVGEVSDDEGDESDDSDGEEGLYSEPTSQSPSSAATPKGSGEAQGAGPATPEQPTTEEETFELNGPQGGKPPTVIIDEEDRMPANDVKAEFLQWHHRLGHASPAKIRMMASLGILPRRLAKCPIPVCTSCLYGKATRRQWRNKPKSSKGATRTATRPGECVSVDQLASPTPGLIAQLRGIPTTKRYKCVTVFCDQATGYGYVHLQKSTGADETLEGVKAFETRMAAFGVTVRHYHADNGIFADNKFRAACRDKGQTLSFCGVNAHFMNGVAERRIRELSELGRTMLIHANRRWPEAITHHLWPYAIRHANQVYNNMPRKGDPKGRSPLQLISGSDVQLNTKHWVPFGCPVYALDNALQSGKKINKWAERTRVGVYLGFSPQHARSVALVLSLRTGLTSPQFHVRYDHKFETMRKSFGEYMPRAQWFEKCHFTTEPGSDAGDSGDANFVEFSGTEQELEAEEEEVPPEPPDSEGSEGDAPQPEGGSQEQGPADPLQEQEPANPQGHRRTGRRRTRTQRLIEVYEAKMERVRPNYVAFEALATPKGDEDGTAGDPLLAYKSTSDPDTMYLHEAMRQPDRLQWLKAMILEVAAQVKNGNFAIVRRSTVPRGAQVVPGVWAMRRKRRITTQEVYKWKARLNLDGSRQIKGVSYWDTYAPVASWSVIRLILTIAIINKWHSKQIDYVQAYPQADAETDNLYMEVPRGFELKGGLRPKDYVMHVKKNIYGNKAGGRIWNKHLVRHLIKAGFIQSDIDECVFYYRTAVYVLYTDDSILTGPSQRDIESAIRKMQSVGLEITDEGDVGDFLGVRIDRKDDGSIELTQPHLIDAILKNLRMGSPETGTKPTPAAPDKLLRRCSRSPRFDGSFDYRSILGQLQYLNTTRLECSFAINQCARFAADPKKEHGDAIRYIGRYLAGTRNEGLILRPDLSKSFDVHVDADFCGAWDVDEAESDPDTARSRTGYCITYAGCPIYWSSKLQTEHALSSTESEYIAISEALRATIPMMELVKEMAKQGVSVNMRAPKVHCRVFEDNSGALEMARVAKFRPRTKHLNVKFHFFRSYVERALITIHKVDTLDQASDTLTKPLAQVLFEKHRKALLGW
jgi:hypothetical protein